MHPKFTVRRTSLVLLTLVCAVAAMVAAFKHRPAQQIIEKAIAVGPSAGNSAETTVKSRVENPVSLRGAEAIKQLKQQGTYDSLAEAVTAASYAINRVERAPLPNDEVAYEAVNPTQALRASFTGVGVRVHSSGGRKWQLGLRLKGYGYGDHLARVTSGELKAQGNRIEYTRYQKVSAQPRAEQSAIRHPPSAIVEWYVNKADGLEQGFTLSAPPVLRSKQNARAHEHLRLTMTMTGDLRGAATEDGQAVRLHDRHGRQVGSYSQLKAWDATGRELAARLRVRGREMSLEVDDAGASYPVTIDPTIQQEVKLTPRDGVPSSAQFGQQVAISGATAIVGASTEDVGLTRRFGAVYVFVRDGATWSQQQKLTPTVDAPDARFLYRFGYSVAISGNTAIIGTLASSQAGPLNQQGFAIIFERSGTTWSQKQMLSADDGAEPNHIGESVAISGDTAILGDGYDHGDGGSPGQHRAGSAYIFVRRGTTWSKQQKLTAGDNGEFPDGFGQSVAISGETAIIGATNSAAAQGAAYVFARSGTTWGPPQKLQAGDGAINDEFGYSVAISGAHAIVGAINNQGVVGDHKGAAYVFEHSNTLWLQQAKLTASDGTAHNIFGGSVAMSGDTAVVGAHLARKVYVFVRSGTEWTQQQKLPPNDGTQRPSFGYAVDLSGDAIIVGSYSGDAAYVFQTPDTDGDGLPDAWEQNGITVDTAGLVVGTGELAGQGTFINLPAMGADPLHKDIFVHVDWMQQDPGPNATFFKPFASAIKKVIDAFEMAPAEQVNNPDHKRGITLHIDAGPDSIMNPKKTGPQSKWGTLSKAGEVPFQAVIGTLDSNNGLDWSGVDTIKLLHFKPAKRSAVFHYALFANDYAGSGGSSGISREIPSTDFMVTLGTWATPGGTELQQAGTFMHEFGHNLALRHGGSDDINTKPNYLSIMNYAFQQEGLLNANRQRSFDYSRAKLADLNEKNLDENVGISDPAKHFTLWSLRTRLNVPPGANKCAGNDNYYKLFFPSSALDWDCDGARNSAPVTTGLDINGDGVCVSGGPNRVLNSGVGGDDEIRLRRIVSGPNRKCETVAAGDDVQEKDVNFIEPDLLSGFKDWPALVFDGAGKIGNAAGASEPDQMSTRNDEPTMEQILDFVSPALFNEELIAPHDVVTVSPQAGGAPLPVSFDGSASTAVNGTIVDWAWDFGDGTTGAGARVTHTYNTPGDYYASLTVTDSNGHVNLVPLLNLVTAVDGPLPTPTPTPTPTATPTPTPTPIPTPTPTPGPGDVDPTFNATVSSFSSGLGANTIITQPDGKILVGGYFESFGGCARRNIARVNADGSCDQSFDPGLVLTEVFQTVSGGVIAPGTYRVNLEVRALALQPDGKILVGVNGTRGFSNGVLTNTKMLVRLDPDGTLDSSFNARDLNIGPQAPTVYAVAVQADGRVIVGGIFTYNNNGRRVYSVARLNMDGSVDSSFFLPDGGPSINSNEPGTVSALALQPDGKIIIAGFFTTVGSTYKLSLARLNSDGSLDTGFNTQNPTTGVFASGFGIGTDVSAFALQPDGKVLVGGSLGENKLAPGGNSGRAFVRLNSDGSRDTSFSTPFITNQGRGLALQADGKVVVVGTFRFTTPAVRNSIARLNSDGTLDMTFDTPGMKGGLYAVNSDSDVVAVALRANGQIVVGGGYDNFNDALAEGILQLNADGSRDQTFDSNGAGLHGKVNALVQQPDGKLLVGFHPFVGVSRGTKLNSARRGGIGRLNADGATDTTFSSPFDPESIIFGMALQPDGKCIVGGSFRLIGSQNVIEFARLNADGTLDTGFIPPSGGGVHIGNNGAITVQPDGKILANESQGGLVRLNADGSRDTTFSRPLPSGGVDRITLQPDGKIIIAGFFYFDDGRQARIGRLNADGSFDTTFDPGTGPDNFMRALILQPDGKIIIGGKFLNYNGRPRNRLARINADGSLDTSFNPINPNIDRFQNSYVVGAMALQPDGKVVVGSDEGDFTDPQPSRLFRLNTDGSLDSSFPLAGTGIEGNRNVSAILLQADGNIVIGGRFNVVNGVARLGLARLLGSTSTSPTPTPTPTPTSVQFSQPTYSFNEGAVAALITVTRTGDTSGTSSVDFATVDDPAAVRCDDTVNNHGAAYARCDYSSTIATLAFAPGEASKTVNVPLIDDAYVEEPETVQLRLSNQQGTSLGAPVVATLTIVDNDTGPGPNPIDLGTFFVRQQYLDFLTREPEPAGFAAWTSVLSRCQDQFNTDPNSPSAGCDRLVVSSSFFRSQEFQLKGYFVFRFYRVAFGRLPAYAEIFPDMQGVTGATPNEVYQRKAALANSFVQRSEFQTAYAVLSSAAYVAALMGRYNLTGITTPDPANPDAMAKVTLGSGDLIARLNAGTFTRAQVLRAIADSDQVAQLEYNRAFVAIQYYGYLRRTPEQAGYDAWLNYLTAHPTDYRTMVNGFMNSVEYRLRFGQPLQ